MDAGASQVISKAIRIHPLGTISVWTKFHGNPLNSCRGTSDWTKVVDQSTLPSPLAMPLPWLKVLADPLDCYYVYSDLDTDANETFVEML